MQDATSYQELLDRLERAETPSPQSARVSSSSSGAEASRSRRPKGNCGRSTAFRVKIAKEAFDNLDNGCAIHSRAFPRTVRLRGATKRQATKSDGLSYFGAQGQQEHQRGVPVDGDFVRGVRAS